MRICDDRYSRDHARLDLALRFIRHEARTQTIRRWTGLTDDRIRKLYRSYLGAPGAGAVPRPRGRSPRQAAFFTHSPRLRQETALLASLCSLLGALPARRAERRLPAPAVAGPLSGAEPRFAQGLALCEAYEAYRVLVPTARISFEHLICLHRALSRGDELKLAACTRCGALIVTERIALRDTRCFACCDTDSARDSAARP